MPLFNRVILTPVLVSAVAAIGMHGAYGTEETNTPPKMPSSIQQLDQDVDSELWAGMGENAKHCWENEKDQWGRTAATAYVKDVGGTEAHEIPADEAFYLAADSKVWVLAWCEQPTKEI